MEMDAANGGRLEGEIGGGDWRGRLKGEIGGGDWRER